MGTAGKLPDLPGSRLGGKICCGREPVKKSTKVAEEEIKRGGGLRTGRRVTICLRGRGKRFSGENSIVGGRTRLVAYGSYAQTLDDDDQEGCCGKKRC